MRRENWGFALGLTILSLAGCQKVWGFEDFEEGAAQGGSAGSSSGGGAGAGGGGTGGGGASGGSAGAAPCEDGAAPKSMVGVRVSDGSCVWINPKEVTRAEYAAFLANPPAVSGNCTWNTSFGAPQKKQGTTPCDGPGEASDAGTLGDAPVTCVDWCDAYAYCDSRGQTLCAGTYNQPTKGAWFDVCSSNGKNDYPYPGNHQASYCNDSTVSTKTLVATGSKTECKTPSGVFDMAGNASEWLDACTGTTQADQCDTRGGSFNDNASLAMCGGSVAVAKEMGLPSLGFRCCWLPK